MVGEGREKRRKGWEWNERRGRRRADKSIGEWERRERVGMG